MSPASSSTFRCRVVVGQLCWKRAARYPAESSPPTLHAPAIAEHPHFFVELLQIAPAQQSAVTPHVPAAAMQPHVFSELQTGPVAAQQSPARVHAVPPAAHPHLPVETSHTPLQ